MRKKKQDVPNVDVVAKFELYEITLSLNDKRMVICYCSYWQL